MDEQSVPPRPPMGRDALWWRSAPACPQGWSTGPPDLVGVGAQCSGTSWWFRQVTRHPGVCFERGLHFKEVHFFDNLRHFRQLPADYLERYFAHFPRPPDAGLTGEWTPRYMFDPWAVPQLHQAAPAARIVMLLRDPVERCASGHARELRLARQVGRARLDDGMVEEQVARGFYARQVRRVLDAYGAERVLVLQYERCLKDYEGELDRTYDLLGLAPGFRPQGPWNVPHAPMPSAFAQSARGRVLAEAYATDAARLAEIAPDIDLARWPSVRELV